MGQKLQPSDEQLHAGRYASSTIPLTAIRRFCRRIAERFHPQKIILFGSYAYGVPHADSDVDLLVIMSAGDVVNQAIKIDLAVEHPFSLDVLVRTPKQIEMGLRRDDCFLREIMDKGRVLYEAADCSVGAKGGGGPERRTSVSSRRKNTSKHYYARSEAPLQEHMICNSS